MVAMSMEKLKYPSTLAMVRSGHRSNTLAKFLLPMVIILSLVVYFTVTRAEMFADG